MKNAYYLQRSDDSQVWEQVDEHVWNNSSKVVQKDGVTNRYSGNGVVIKDGKIEIVGVMTEKDVGIICRFLSIRVESGSHHNGGFLQSPEFVKIKRGKNPVVHEIGSKAPEPVIEQFRSAIQPGQKIMGVSPTFRAA